MTRPAIAARDRRTLTIGASVIAALFVISRGVPAWRTWVHDAKAGAGEQIAAATQADALVAGARAARDTLAVRNGRYVALAPALVPGVTPAEASASLASMVSQMASAAGVKLGAVQLRPVADTGRQHVFMRVAVHADVVGDIRGITTLLASIERGPVRLRVRDLTLTQPDPAAPTDRVEALHGELSIEGLAMAHTGGGAAHDDTH
jgi:hypothetical protein